MFKIIEEVSPELKYSPELKCIPELKCGHELKSSPELKESPQLKLPLTRKAFPVEIPSIRKPLPVANLNQEEDLSFEDISQKSSEIDEKEARILKFLELEEVAISNPKEKEWEYAEKVKEKTFLIHSNSKKAGFGKRFTLDNADLYQKRRSSCLDLGKTFLSPLTTKTRNEFDEDYKEILVNNNERSQIKKHAANFFGLRTFANEMNPEEANDYDAAKKHKTSPLLLKNEIFKDFKLLIPMKLDKMENV